ncbi:TPR-like protein, partial [Thelephora ganbajun]
MGNICLCITSRISTAPPDCKSLDIPTLSMEAARDTFYRIYENGEQSDSVNKILRQLDFHPLSITLLATVAHHNKWGTRRLAKEWEKQRTGMLRAQRDKSLAATIELSLTSPTFIKLGPDARDLLGVIAFFPQGVNEDNLEWLFPIISDKEGILDKFCLLSLTYRSNGFVTMLAPLRDYLSPKGPGFSPLLHTTKGHYFRKLSVEVDPSGPGFEETRWITSEDVNVEHLLDVFTSVDANSDGVWRACAHFMEHLYWHRPRLIVLGPKVEGLPDSHPSKPECLVQLSRLFWSVGNRAEDKRLLIHTLKLWRERGDDFEVAETLRFLSKANRYLALYEEGISQANEALEIYERHNHIFGQAQTLQNLAFLLYADEQFDAAETAASRSIDLSSSTNNRLGICECHRVLGNIYRSKGETEKAISHYETALGIASSSNWNTQLFWNHYALARLFLNQGGFSDAHVHIERAKSHTVNNPYSLGRAMELEAQVLDEERRFEDAKSEASRAAGIFERLGAAGDLER